MAPVQQPSTVMVTGGAGYIGSHATRRLLQGGWKVLVVDDLSHGHRAAVDPRAELIVADFGDRPRMAEVLRDHEVDAVMHFAAFIEVGESVEDPSKYYLNNVANAIQLLAAMRDAGTQRLIFSSTAAVYGNPVRTPIDEEHPLAPINPYGRTKAIVESAIADHARAYGMGYAILRYFNVAGASPDGAIGEAHEPESHLVPRLLAVAAGKGDRAQIFGTDYPTHDGTCIRDYIHVEDLVEAHVLALAKVRSGGGGHVFNLGSESGFTVREVIEACRKVTGGDVPADERPRRAGDPAVLVASSAKIRKELGWTLRYPSLETIVSHAWQWHRAHPLGYSSSRA